MNNVNLGILGFAHGHVNHYCSRWRQAPDMGVRIAAGWDHDAARLAQAMKLHELAGEKSVNTLLARRDIDAVVIAAETAYHADLAIQAAAAGKTIIMQKPLSLTLDQADRIVDAVGRAGVPFSLAWQMRVDPQNLRIKQLLDEGVVGRVFMVRRRHGLPTHLWGERFAQSWHAQPDLNRGMWADDAAHAVDFLLWLMGKPISVTAEIATLHNRAVPDDNGIAIYQYRDGTMAEVMSSFTCPAGENTTEIVGEKGVIIQNFGDSPSCNAPRLPNAGPGLKWFTVDDNQWHLSDIATPVNHSERIGALALPLSEYLHGKRPAIATAQEGQTALQMTLAAYDSAQAGRRINLE